MDSTADVVVEELNRRDVPVLRFDLDDVAVSAELDGPRWVGELRVGDRVVALEDVRGIYYRRPSRPSGPPHVDPAIAAWTSSEARWGLRGLLVALPRHLWLNWPPAVHAAEHKPWQLCESAEVGLGVPRTAITNVPDAATRFAHDAQPVLYKAFRGDPVQIDGASRLVYATRVAADQCADEAVRLAPVMLQAQIDKAFDARVTCVDRHVFAVSPRGVGGSVPLDWRVDHNANTWHEVAVPALVRSGLGNLLNRLDLRFAACDFSIDHAGNWWFLEVNPAGQWAWDHPLHDAIASAIADGLSQEGRRGDGPVDCG